LASQALRVSFLGLHCALARIAVSLVAPCHPAFCSKTSSLGIFRQALYDDEALINYAKPTVTQLRANMVRVDADYSATPFKAKISNAVAQTASLLCRKLATCAAKALPTASRRYGRLPICATTASVGAGSVRLHHEGPPGAKPKAEVVPDILASIKELRAQERAAKARSHF
jgi:hypothetical protein